MRSRAARLDSHVRGEDEIKSLVCIALLTLCSAAANTTPNAWSDYKRLKAVSVGFGGRGGQVKVRFCGVARSCRSVLRIWL
ncbi:MAG TPA: hypothetical protein VM715_05240, partial [Candidatus Acidoferrum sp.]|nr:hypothetical protein [Candidatus Acidoferrum sp.]